MLLVKTKLAPSSIHGLGVFADEFIPKGALVWRWHNGVDKKINRDYVDVLPQLCKDVIKKYAWIDKDGMYRLCSDHTIYFNHSKNGNVGEGEFDGDFALRDIQIGEEITIDYSLFDENFGNPEFGYDWVEETE